MVAYSPNVLLVNPSVPAKSVKELIELIKANPNKYPVSPDPVSAQHRICRANYSNRSSAWTWSTFLPGAAQAISSAIAGHTPIAFTALPPALSNIQDGNLHALAVLAVKRNAEIPNVPTMLEAGYPDEEADTLTGVLAPAGTPNGIVDLLQREIAKAVTDPGVRERLFKLGFEPVANKPQEFGARIKSEISKWGTVVHDANLRINDEPIAQNEFRALLMPRKIMVSCPSLGRQILLPQSRRSGDAR